MVTRIWLLLIVNSQNTYFSDKTDVLGDMCRLSNGWFGASIEFPDIADVALVLWTFKSRPDMIFGSYDALTA